MNKQNDFSTPHSKTCLFTDETTENKRSLLLSLHKEMNMYKETTKFRYKMIKQSK
uniref:Uncharacterized protein n=1 Tax=Nelumbo nucifera TaxID=4432 RepID=A0A822Z533_NELNU|nr:TPA_asm: hypothetical protein HUJ06_013133 [Nelumbo nucifera]